MPFIDFLIGLLFIALIMLGIGLSKIKSTFMMGSSIFEGDRCATIFLILLFKRSPLILSKLTLLFLTLILKSKLFNSGQPSPYSIKLSIMVDSTVKIPFLESGSLFVSTKGKS